MRKDLQDNDCSQYSEEARQWATEKGIVLGGGTLEDGEPNYMWQDMLTREQFVTVLYLSLIHISTIWKRRRRSSRKS